MGSFPKEELAGHPNLVAYLFRLERQNSPDEVNALVDEVKGWFRQHPGYERLRGLFTELIRNAFERCGVSLPESGNLLEQKSMLADSIRSWQKQWFAEGEAKGKAEALIALLAGRFGEVAPTWRNQIQGAELATLERWFERAIAAPDLPSVFNPPG